MTKSELFDLFFDPVFQKCLRHAQAGAPADGTTILLELYHYEFLCILFQILSIKYIS